MRTREGLKRRIQESTARLAATLAGAGVALSLSIIFAGPGIALLVVAAMIAALGWLIFYALANFLPYRELICPHCGTASGVLSWVREFECTGCLVGLAVDGLEERKSEVLALEQVGRRVERQLLMMLVVIAYIFFFIEVFLGHYARLLAFKGGLVFNGALIPLFFSPVALVISLAMMGWPNAKTVLLFRITMVISLMVAMAGTYFHMAPRINGLGDAFDVFSLLGDPPALAPLAFSLPGIIGLVATWGIRLTGEPGGELPLGITGISGEGRTRAVTNITG